VLDNEPFIHYVRLAMVVLAVFLAWITYRFIERPIRFGEQGNWKLGILCGLMIVLGGTGLIFSKRDFSLTHTYEQLLIQRKGFEHAYGTSLAWFRGKEDWLFLGNAHDNGIAKLKLAITPTATEVATSTETFTKIAATSANFHTKVVLLMGPR
jgi:hypothetical protein